MGRQPSDKTLLATERRENKRLRQELNALRLVESGYRARATKAEQEVSEWKRRFDDLLRVKTTPVELPVVGSGVATSVDCGCPSLTACWNTACPRRANMPTLSAGAEPK